MFLKKNTIILLFYLAVTPAFSQSFYDLSHVPVIELTFVEKDWAYPLHYLHSLKKGERHIGHVTIDSIRYDSVGVRFKGFSSYNRKNKKNPLNIRLDYVQKKADHQKYETIKLSNGLLDPSWLREILAYRIARKYMVAPQSNYAKVFVNDEYYGVFGNTESIDGKFAKRYLPANKKNVIVKGNSPLGPFMGKRSSLEYLGTDTTLYYTSYEMKSKHGWGELYELIDVLNNRPEDIESILNLDGAIWMLAFNNVLVNLDSYSDFQQNYYLIQDDNGRFNFIPWDLNLAFDGLGKPMGITKQPNYDPLAKKDDMRFPLINLVLNNEEYKKQYFAHCRTILKENFENGWYKIESEKYRTLISDAVKQDTNWRYDIDAFNKNYKETYIARNSTPFPFPGITELMDERVDFLNTHPEYKKKPPFVLGMGANLSDSDSTMIRVTSIVADAEKVYLYFRKNKKDIFQKIEMKDDGVGGDKRSGDEIFTAMIPLGTKGTEYYIYTENKMAGIFSPERAAHEFYIFEKEKELPF